MQYDGFSKVSAAFTIVVATIVVGSAVADVYVNWGQASLRTVNDNIEAVLTAVYGIMIFIIGFLKYLRPKQSQKKTDFSESEFIVVVLSYALLMAFVLFAVYKTGTT